jgi:HlyD family secretion protein
MKHLAPIAYASVAVLGLVAVLWSQRPKPLEVEVATAARGPLTQTVVDDGRARVRQRYTVSAPVAGVLSRIELDEGDPVEPSMVLARVLPAPSPLLDPRSREVAVEHLAAAIELHKQAQASVTRAEAAEAEAAREKARIANLVASGAATAATADQADADARMRAAELSSARFSAKVAEHEIAQARAALERYAPSGKASEAGAGAPSIVSKEQFEITSPIHGRVLHVLHKSEGAVAAGAALLEIGDPGALELVVDVRSQDAVTIRPGMPAKISSWGGDQPLVARVRRVEPSAFTKTSALGVDEQRVNVVLDPQGPASVWASLGDGFALSAEITTWSATDALSVPTSALFRTARGMAVFVVEGGEARSRDVAVGHGGPLSSELVSGLTAGAIVIVHPGPSVRDGVAVTHR